MLQSCKVEKKLDLTNGLRDFLMWLPEDYVMGILKVTTGGLIFAETKNEAIANITKYSDAVSVLNRQKIRKDILIKYLHERNVSFKFPIDKSALCRLCLTQWGEQNVQNYKFLETADKPNDIYKASTASSANNSLTEVTLEETLHSVKSTYRSYTPTQTPSNSPNPQLEEDSQPILRSSQDDHNMEVDSNFYQEVRKQELKIGQELGIEFSKWFFDRWNKLDDFATRHFWQECNLRLEIIHGNSLPSTSKEVLNNGPQCCEEMTNLILRERLYFNPNIQYGVGVRGKINPNGLAQVLVCGSVHRDGSALGIFEQVFGLMKDPSDGNNYKVRFSVLRFRSGATLVSNTLPSLCDSTLKSVLDEEED